MGEDAGGKAQPFLGLLALGDVLGEEHNAAYVAIARQPGMYSPLYPLHAAVRPVNVVLAGLRRFSGQTAAMRLFQAFRQIGEYLIGGVSDDLLANQKRYLQIVVTYGEKAHLAIEHGQGDWSV